MADARATPRWKCTEWREGDYSKDKLDPRRRSFDLLRKDLLVSLGCTVFVEVDLQIEANNGKHHTSEVSLEQLVLRRGQPFNLTIKLAQPFDLKRDPLNMSAETGWSQLRGLGFQTFPALIQRQNPNI